MRIDEFLEKFNDGLSSSEKLSRSDFSTEDGVMKCWKGGHGLDITLGEDGDIAKVGATVLRVDETVAELHSWMQQTVKVFYPNSLIARSFFVELLGMALESISMSDLLTGYRAQVEKFPVLFDMGSTTLGCTLTVFVNDPEAHKQDLAKVVKESLSSRPTTESKPAEQPRKKKANVRDPQYLNEIRAAIYGMPVIEAGKYSKKNDYYYYPRKYPLDNKFRFETCIAHSREKGDVSLFLGIHFPNSWDLGDETTFNCDGKIFIMDDYREIVIYSYYCYENSRWGRVDKEDNGLVQSILTARNIYVSCEGSNRVFTLSKQNIQDMKKTYDVYCRLVEVERRWDAKMERPGD